MHPQLQQWIDELTAEDGTVRERARTSLIELGAEAVEPLLGATEAGGHTRWEALKALGAIADERALPTFLAALDDESSDARWLAAEGLASLGRPALEPLLKELIHGDVPDERRRAIHHVLQHQPDPSLTPILGPLLRAFSSDVAHIDVPRVALEAVQALHGAQPRG